MKWGDLWDIKLDSMDELWDNTPGRRIRLRPPALPTELADRCIALGSGMVLKPLRRHRVRGSLRHQGRTGLAGLRSGSRPPGRFPNASLHDRLSITSTPAAHEPVDSLPLSVKCWPSWALN